MPCAHSVQAGPTSWGRRGEMRRSRRPSSRCLWCRTALSCARLGALAFLFPLGSGVVAQEARPEVLNDAAETTAPAPAPNSSFAPGFIDTLGRWMGDSRAALDSQLKNTQEAIGGIGAQATDALKGAAGAAQQTTGAIIGLPVGQMITGRQLCAPAANGAPDCGPAAETLCKAKGFSSGRGLEVASTQRCSARIWRSRPNPADGPCGTETFVTRAVCQ
jgi:hypothetical protein